ncbi:MAG: DNA primase small subunit PriS [Promethearchaeati archaeon SRVP18_Atabeyarchaeia-1]
MNAETAVYLNSMFMEYYETRGSSMVVAPKDLIEREFAFTYFGREGMFRHLGFRGPEELLSSLRVNGPSHSYFSAAHYVDPDAGTMGQKGWKGTDLIFDIDADHLDVTCKDKHDRWLCKDCGNAGLGARPEKCPACQSQKIDDEMWLCDNCIGQAKLETLKLIEILCNDFGFSRKDVEVTYTGHRGYHTKVTSPSIYFLTASERREIVDYITARGIDLQAYGLMGKDPHSRRNLTGPGKDDIGWGSRIYRSVVEMIEKGEAPFQELENKDMVLREMAAARWDQVNRVALKKWNKLVMKAIDRDGIAHIDEPVTTDIHRLIRLQGSLHGKTGFIVTKVDDLESFEPFRDAIAFGSSETVTVHIDKSKAAHSFRIGDQTYGPFVEEKCQLPMEFAIFFMCKGVAEIEREGEAPAYRG